MPRRLGVKTGTTTGYVSGEIAGNAKHVHPLARDYRLDGGRVLQAARLAFQYQPQPFSITFDRPLSEVLPATSQTRMSAGTLAGTTIRRKALLVVAANGPYYGGGFAVAAGACIRDGRLTLSIYRRFSKWELLRHFHSISQGRYRYSPKIETFSAEEIELASPNVIAVHIDGRPLQNDSLSAAPSNSFWSVHSESNDETNRAKNIFKEEGAHDISSTGEAHSEVKAEDVSGTAGTRDPKAISRSGLLESDVPSSEETTLRKTERNL